MSLEKTIIFIRHANREPIAIFKEIHIDYDILTSRLIDLMKDPSQAQLIEKGRENASAFGEVIRKKHGENFKLFSSPVKRCQDTIYHLTNRTDIVVDDVFRFSVSKIFKKNYTLSNYAVETMGNSTNLRQYISTNLGVSFEEPLDFYYIYSSLKCYEDMGVNLNNYITPIIREIFCAETVNLYNDFFDRYAETNRKHMMDVLNSLPNESSIVCTHDHLIFALAKCYTKKKLCLPEYLSNIRFEYFSNGTIKIYYDDVELN